MVTIKEIAIRAGVAKSTVSNVLSGKKYVSPEITEKVKKICKELDYHPNFYASLLSAKSRTNIVGLFLEESVDGKYRKFYSDLIASAISSLSNYNNNLLVYSGLNKTETIIKLTNGKSPIDGAIILSPTLDDDRLLKIKNTMLPVVTIGQAFGDCDISSVDINNHSLVKVVTRQLIKRGYNNIALLNANERLTISKDRYNGLTDGSRDCLCTIKNFYTNSQEDDGYQIAKKEILNGTNAFITASEVVAAGVYRACNELNRKIPDDVAVFSLGCNSDSTMDFTPKLSYAYQDYNVLGAHAVKILMDIINGNKEIVHKTIDCAIHYQESFKIKEK